MASDSEPCQKLASDEIDTIVLPYQFEPESDMHDESSKTNDAKTANRVGNTAWCVVNFLAAPVPSHFD